MTSVPSFLSAGMTTGALVSPVTPGGRGKESVTGPVNPLVRVIVAFTSSVAPRLIAPLFAGARAIVAGAGLTVTVTAAAGKNALIFCGLATLAVSVAFLSAAVLAAIAALFF